MGTRQKYLFLLLVGILIISHRSLAQNCQDCEFKDRGNRNEGTKPFGVSGPDLELFSFIGYFEEASLDTNYDLMIKFYMKKDTTLFITAKEISPQKFYLMKPKKTYWPKGWQTFSPWPTKEVLIPLKIRPDQLGIIGQIGSDRPGPGEIVPLIIYHTKDTKKIGIYTLYFRSRENLSKVNYTIYKVDKRENKKQEIKAISLRKEFYSEIAFSITIDLSNEAEGYFEISISFRPKNQLNPRNRTYTFYHNPRVQR